MLRWFLTYWIFKHTLYIYVDSSFIFFMILILIMSFMLYEATFNWFLYASIFPPEEKSKQRSRWVWVCNLHATDDYFDYLRMLLLCIFYLIRLISYLILYWAVFCLLLGGRIIAIHLALGITVF